MDSKNIALMSVLASLYVVMGLFIPMYSFGQFQCRISDALYPLIAVLGTPAMWGLFLGHLIYNTYGYISGFALGPLDMIVSPFLFLIPKHLIKRYGYKAVPVHVIFVGLWVPFLICLVNPNTPWMAYPPILLSVMGGEVIAEVILGIPLAKLVKKRLLV